MVAVVPEGGLVQDVRGVRRRLLGAIPAAAFAGLVPAARARAASTRELWVTRPQAQESVRAVYWCDGAPVPEGIRALEHVFRDVMAGVVHPIDLALLDLNHALQRALEAAIGPRPIVLFSGYRTARTSERVGGTRPDIHGEGRADDFILPGLGFEDNLRLARMFQVGGLGAYPARGVLHKDVGALRSWIDRRRSPREATAP